MKQTNLSKNLKIKQTNNEFRKDMKFKCVQRLAPLCHVRKMGKKQQMSYGSSDDVSTHSSEMTCCFFNTSTIEYFLV